MPNAMRQAAAPSPSMMSNQGVSAVNSSRGSITQGTGFAGWFGGGGGEKG